MSFNFKRRRVGCLEKGGEIRGGFRIFESFWGRGIVFRRLVWIWGFFGEFFDCFFCFLKMLIGK